MEIPLRNSRQQLPQLPALAHGCKPNCTLLQGHFDFRGWPQAGAFRKRLRNPDRQAVAPLLNPGSHAISVSTMSLLRARRKARPRAANVRKLSGEPSERRASPLERDVGGSPLEEDEIRSPPHAAQRSKAQRPAQELSERGVPKPWRRQVHCSDLHVLQTDSTQATIGLEAVDARPLRRRTPANAGFKA